MRRRKRNRMRGADEADRDGIDDGAVARRDQPIEPVAIPGRARDLDEGAALRRGLELALARGHEGGRELGDLAQAPHRRATPRRDAHAPETRRRKIPARPRASRPASPATTPRRRYRRPPPPIRCRWNRRTRRPETTATARSSAGTAPPPRFVIRRSPIGAPRIAAAPPPAPRPGGLFVVMSMGMAVVMVVIAMLVMVMIVIMAHDRDRCGMIMRDAWPCGIAAAWAWPPPA